ncbi:MAG: YdcF family protein, partial [Pirellulaceae bacterium]|nr:YdcF family protein [Pirellulaceae bacterium]
TRSATDLVLPIGLIWIGLFACAGYFALQKQWLASWLFAIMFATLGITGNRYVAFKFIQSVELPVQQPQATTDDPYRTVIVLGGGAELTRLSTAELNRDGERIFSAAQLWHAGLVSSIICTGSVPDGSGDPQHVGKELLESVGVPTAVIYTLPGENTSQEMLSLREFFDNPPDSFPESGDTALITSAFHIRRALRLAATQQLDFDPLPCGYRSENFSGFSPRALIPAAEAAESFGLVLKELLGGLVGR